MFIFSDPPDVSLEGITPATEYTTRNITCRINGGNPSDPRCYSYEWTYKPTYINSTTYIPVPTGMC